MYYKSRWGNTLKAFDKKHYKMKIEHHKEFGNVDYWLKLNRTVLNDNSHGRTCAFTEFSIKIH